MDNKDEIERIINTSVPCIIIEIRMSLQGPVVTAKESTQFQSPLLPREVREHLLTAMDVAVKAALTFLRSSPDYAGEQFIEDTRGLSGENYFDGRTITLDAD